MHRYSLWIERLIVPGGSWDVAPPDGNEETHPYPNVGHLTTSGVSASMARADPEVGAAFHSGSQVLVWAEVQPPNPARKPPQPSYATWRAGKSFPSDASVFFCQGT